MTEDDKWDSLKEWIEDLKEQFIADSKEQESSEFIVNKDELVWGSKCKVSTCDRILNKMSRIEIKTKVN